MDEQAIHQILSGRRTGPAAMFLRTATGIAEPFYATLMRLRNLLYDRGILPSRQAPVPVISVGNITAGGTGKTPMVRWLARALGEQGLHPGVLLRGYKGTQGWSDEQELLSRLLPGVPVVAQPDRVAGALRLLADHPDTGVLLLDDGYQHRRLARNFDLVLVDATRPFGYGHVHPRGLLREPLAGLRRAHAIVLTRCDLVDTPQRRMLEEQLHGLSPQAGIYRARHLLCGLRLDEGGVERQLPLDWLVGQRWLAVAGIGNPGALEQQLQSLPGTLAGTRWFPDHHDYTAGDLRDVAAQADSASATLIIVTEKDWTKLRRLDRKTDCPVPIARLELELAFDEGRDRGLLELILARLERET